MTLGDLVKNYREKNNITMDEFSKTCSLSKGYISMLENNTNPRNNKPIAPTLPTIKKIALAMNVDVDSILDALDSDQEINLDFKSENTPEIGNRIIQLRKEKGYATRKSFAEKLRIPETTLKNYEKNERKPGYSFLIELSDIFDVSTDYLLGVTDEKRKIRPYELKASEYEHIKKYRTLDKFGKERIDYELEKEIERTTRIQELETENQEISEKIRLLRIYTYFGRIACAGESFDFSEIPDETIEAPYMEGADFIIGVNGDSMEPDYHDGDRLYVKKTDHMSYGDVGIFTINNECFLKEYGEDGLVSRNKNYKDIAGTEDVRLIGKVIGKVGED